MSHLQTGLLTVHSGDRVRLADIDADSTGQYSDRDDAEKRCKHLEKKIYQLQRALYAEHKQALLIVLQAMDTGGKDGAIRNLLTGINPQGVRVTPFGVPTPIEAAHDFLWRVHIAAPAHGMIGVWNRSHYEDVLVVRVHDLVPEEVWRPRFDSINHFEQLLTRSGTTVLKFYLHISRDEQKQRLQDRLDEPDKNWKFSAGDLEERKYWDEYQRAFEEVLNQCSTPWAPWNIVPANHKWARDVAIAEKVADALENMNPQYPQADFDVEGVVIE